MRATYHKGGYPNLLVDWGDPANEDLTGYNIDLYVFPFGGAESFHKNAGFAIPGLNTDGTVPSPNLIVTWTQAIGDELDGLADGTYVMKFTATGHVSKPPLEMFGELVLRINAPNFGYCELADLKYGDLKIATSLNPYEFINAAADKMDAAIGQRYLLPLNLGASPTWVQSLLRTINADLATGTLLCAQAQGGEDAQLHAWGKYLMDQANAQIMSIACGDQNLPGITRDPSSIRANAPEIIQEDAVSAVAVFSNFAQRREVFFRTTQDRWRPGSA